MTCTGCAQCAGATLIAIRMRIGGEDLVFQRCARCETNHWAASGGEISLEDVLELARVPR
jgi:hypothetical protein